MKLTKVLAAVSACAVAACTMAITSFATVTNDNNGGAGYLVDLATVDGAFGDVYGAKVELTIADGWEETGTGGGVIIQGDGLDWSAGSREFGISGEGEDIKNVDGVSVSVSGNVLTVTYEIGDAPLFASTATWGQLIVQSWWGADITVGTITYLGADGAALGGDDNGDAVTTTTAAGGNTVTTTTAAGGATTTAAGGATTTAAGGATTTAAAASSATGVEGVASVIALLTIAGAAIVITKKH